MLHPMQECRSFSCILSPCDANVVCCVCTLGARLTCDCSYTGSNCFAVACGSAVRVEMLRHHEPLKMFYVTVRARKNGESVSLLLAHSAVPDKQVHIIV